MAVSFKGLYKAWDFAYGVNPNAVGALQVTVGSTVAGTYTIKCSPTALDSADGIKIILNTNTPILIGAATGLETVTPTAVSINTLNEILITATFTYAHSVGAQIRSGSGGIAEAVNFVNAQTGGGLVCVTTESGLTNAGSGAGSIPAAILATLGYAKVPILNYGGGVGATSYRSTGTSTPVAYTAGIAIY